MTAENLLNRLEKVKRTGQGRWIARCPAHDDRNPSLAITEKADGMVLVKCFSGCGIDAITAAAGIEMADLFPEPLPETKYEKVQRRELFHSKDVLAALAFETTVVAVAAAEIQRKGYLNDREFERLELASERIAGGLAYAGANG